MNALRLLAIVLVVSVAACRKRPAFEFSNPFGEASPKAATPAMVAATPKPPPKTTPAPPSVDRSSQIIALGYHRFVDKVRHPDTEITTAEFESQLKALKDQGITVVSLDDFLAWRRGEKSIPARSALITIDDGYNQSYTVAWPILKKYGYPFTMFVYTDYIKGGKRTGGGSMSWEQLAEMRDAGVSIQSHTVSHARLNRPPKGAKDDKAYEDWLWSEINGSKALLEERLGIKVTSLALPYGLSNDRVRETAAKAGYEMLFTVNGQKLSYGTPMNALGRYMVQANQAKLFATMTTFEGSRSDAGSAIAAVQVQDIHPQPPDNSTIDDPNPLIQANLTSLGTIEAKSVSMRLSGRGEVPARFDPKTSVISYQARGLLPSKYTVIVGATAAGKKTECRWSFSIEPPRPAVHTASAAPAP